jgi:hypothetical protein
MDQTGWSPKRERHSVLLTTSCARAACPRWDQIPSSVTVSSRSSVVYSGELAWRVWSNVGHCTDISRRRGSGSEGRGSSGSEARRYYGSRCAGSRKACCGIQISEDSPRKYSTTDYVSSGRTDRFQKNRPRYFFTSHALLGHKLHFLNVV